MLFLKSPRNKSATPVISKIPLIRLFSRHSADASGGELIVSCTALKIELSQLQVKVLLFLLRYVQKINVKDDISLFLFFW